MPEALEHRLIVTRSFDFFLPSAVFSELAARVTSGSSRKFNPVSSQLKIWLRERFSSLNNFLKGDTNCAAFSFSLDSFSP